MTSTLAGLIDCIQPQLESVDKLFTRELASDLECVNSLVKHVSRFRGKMLRPTLLLLSGKACGELTAAHVTLATVVEMVHMATLVHDDVLDEAELRRKGATLNHLRGNEAAVLLGDYLISHSYHLCSSLDSQLASRLIASTTNQLCEGELLQLQNRNNASLDETTYLKIITRKTATLCGTCCRLGAQFTGATDEQMDRLGLYGVSLGRAFQIQDDILDIVGDPNTVGKTLGRDVEKGKMTLPLIHFMRNAPLEHRELLRLLLNGREPDRVEKIRNLILPSQSITYAREKAHKLVNRAQDAISSLIESEAKRTLHLIAEFVIDRPM